MSTQWEDIIGNFSTLKTAKVTNAIVNCYYKTILKRFEQLTSEGREVNPDFVDPYATCLSFAEEATIANHKGKDKPKFTYEAEVTETEEVEKDGKKIKKSTGKKKMAIKTKGKICTATADGKDTLTFWLLKYVKEIKDLYVANNNRFPEESHLLSELETFTSTPADIGSFTISPFILNLTDRIDANKVVEPVYGDLDSILVTTLSALFKNDNGTPTVQLTKLVTKWVQFLKLMALQAAGLMWYKKARVDSETLKVVLRQLTLVGNRDVTLDAMFFQVLDEYIAEAARLAEEQSKLRKEKAVANKAAKENADAAGASEPSTETDEFVAGLDDVDDISSSLAAEANEWANDSMPDA
jgi:hypothetical protein